MSPLSKARTCPRTPKPDPRNPWFETRSAPALLAATLAALPSISEIPFPRFLYGLVSIRVYPWLSVKGGVKSPHSKALRAKFSSADPTSDLRPLISSVPCVIDV